jgi:hypothetical protein
MLTRDQTFSFQGMASLGPVPIDVDTGSPDATEQAMLLHTFALQFASTAAPPAVVAGIGQPVKPIRFPEPDFRRRQRWVRLSGQADIVVEVRGQIVNRVDLVGESLTPVAVGGLVLADRWLRAIDGPVDAGGNRLAAERWMAGVSWVRAGVGGQTFAGKDLAGTVETAVLADARMSVDPAFLEWERRARAEESSVLDVVALFRR